VLVTESDKTPVMPLEQTRKFNPDFLQDSTLIKRGISDNKDKKEEE
jgi:hypothetical protein